MSFMLTSHLEMVLISSLFLLFYVFACLCVYACLNLFYIYLYCLINGEFLSLVRQTTKFILSHLLTWFDLPSILSALNFNLLLTAEEDFLPYLSDSSSPHLFYVCYTDTLLVPCEVFCCIICSCLLISFFFTFSFLLLIQVPVSIMWFLLGFGGDGF